MARHVLVLFSCLFTIAVASKLPFGLGEHMPSMPVGKGLPLGHKEESTTMWEEMPTTTMKPKMMMTTMKPKMMMTTTMKPKMMTTTMKPGMMTTTMKPGMMTTMKTKTTMDWSSEEEEGGSMTTEGPETTTMKKCGKREVWTDCGSACEPTCKDSKPMMCTKQCVPGCVCRKGHKRDEKGRCVKHC